MKLLRIIPSLDPRQGGPAEAARRFDTELIRRGHEVEVASLDPIGSKVADGYPAVIHNLGSKRGGYGYTAALVPWLRLNAARFDAALVDGLWQYHGFAAWRAFAGGSLPYFVYTHGMLDPWFKKTYPLKHFKKALYWPWAEYRVLRDAQAVLFTCEEERRLARQSFSFYKAREAVTSFGTSDVPSDANALSREFLCGYPHLQGLRLALYLGRIQGKKGGDLLLKGFADVALKDRQLHLVMAGPEDTDWGLKLRQIAMELGISERVTWTGMLSGPMKWGAFYASEVFCLPSHQENFGIAVSEALACGKPVLISDKVNIWREIETDGAGWVESDTVAGTKRLFEKWLTCTPVQVSEIGAKARSSFERRFKIDQAVRSLVEIIESKLIQTPGFSPTPV